MSFDLDSIISKPKDSTPMITLTGDPGIGKTSLAATFHKPIFIQAEAGMASIPDELKPKSFERTTSAFPAGGVKKDDFSNLQRQLAAVLNANHDYKTLVIDSITSLARLMEKEIIEEEPDKSKKTMGKAHGSYGKAYKILGERLAEIHETCEKIRDERGMTIVFIAHSDTETYDPPDGEPFSRHTLRLNKAVKGPFIDGVDILAYMTIDMYTKGEKGEKKKAVTTGQRLIRCTTNASSDAKNRYHIKSDIPVIEGVNPFFEYVPALMQYAQKDEPEA